MSNAAAEDALGTPFEAITGVQNWLLILPVQYTVTPPLQPTGPSVVAHRSSIAASVIESLGLSETWKRTRTVAVGATKLPTSIASVAQAPLLLGYVLAVVHVLPLLFETWTTRLSSPSSLNIQ